MIDDKKKLKVWNLSNGRYDKSKEININPLDLLLSKDGTILITSHEDKLIIWDYKNMKMKYFTDKKLYNPTNIRLFNKEYINI